MSLVSLSYEAQDEELALRVIEKLRREGVGVLIEPVEDRDLPDIQRADGAAARAKAADLVAVLAAADGDSLDEAKRSLRAATVYSRRIAAARLSPEVALEQTVREASARFGDDAQGGGGETQVFRSFDLFGPERAFDLDDEPGFGDRYDDGKIEAFADHLLRAADLGRKERLKRETEFDEDDVDGFGFPRSPAAMLSRWRLIEPQGDVAALENFLADYADDPYFAIRAASAIRTARRRQGRARGAIGYHLAMATLLAAGVIGFGSQICGPEGCSFANGLNAFRSGQDAGWSAPLAGAGGEGDAAAGKAAQRAEAARRRADAARAAALREMAALREEMAELRDERDDLQSRFDALNKSSSSGGGVQLAAATQRADRAERTLKQTRGALAKLEGEQDRLRDSLTAARRDRDRFEDAAKERADELAKLRRRLARQDGEKDLADDEALARLEARLKQARDDLRKSEDEVSRMRKELSKATAQNASLRAELEERNAALRAAELAAREAKENALRNAALQTPAVRRPDRSAEENAASPRRERRVRQQPSADRLARRSSSRSGGYSPAVGLRTDDGRRGRLVPRTAQDPRAVRRVLNALRKEMSLSPAGRRAEAGAGRAYLRPKGVRILQRCLRRGAGARIAADGVWGRRTTSALLRVTGPKADRVASCLRGGRLRR